jgi:hypothetical protein
MPRKHSGSKLNNVSKSICSLLMVYSLRVMIKHAEQTNSCEPTIKYTVSPRQTLEGGNSRKRN